MLLVILTNMLIAFGAADRLRYTSLIASACSILRRKKTTEA